MKKAPYFGGQSGMSLTELVTVLTIITVLIVASIPAFFYLRARSAEREMRETIGIVQSQIAGRHYGELVLDNQEQFPSSLDANPENAPCTECFEAVLEKGIENPLWFKVAPNEYRFSANRNSGKPADYDEKGDFKVSYDPSNGLIAASRIEQ